LARKVGLRCAGERPRRRVEQLGEAAVPRQQLARQAALADPRLPKQQRDTKLARRRAAELILERLELLPPPHQLRA
jgi:hypothetical protein